MATQSISNPSASMAQPKVSSYLTSNFKPTVISSQACHFYNTKQHTIASRDLDTLAYRIVSYVLLYVTLLLWYQLVVKSTFKFMVICRKLRRRRVSSSNGSNCSSTSCSSTSSTSCSSNSIIIILLIVNVAYYLCFFQGF